MMNAPLVMCFIFVFGVALFVAGKNPNYKEGYGGRKEGR
jgi:hypothetical protein